MPVGGQGGGGGRVPRDIGPGWPNIIFIYVTIIIIIIIIIIINIGWPLLCADPGQHEELLLAAPHAVPLAAARHAASAAPGNPSTVIPTARGLNSQNMLGISTKQCNQAQFEDMQLLFILSLVKNAGQASSMGSLLTCLVAGS